VHPDDVPIIEEEVRLSNTPGYKNSGDSEYRIRNAAGEWRWIISAVPDLRFQRQFLYFIGIARTSRQKQRNRETATRRKSANHQQIGCGRRDGCRIAHEINNPLTGVLGFAELIMEKDTYRTISGKIW